VEAPQSALRRAFYALTPDTILAAVEAADPGGRRATGYALSLNSFENRVYEVELEDGARLVAKFYRPGRWSEAAIRAEHAFLRELVEAEVPAVAPLGGDETLFSLSHEGVTIRYALFDKVRGRPTEEPDGERLAILGRLIARLHTVGAARSSDERGRLDPLCYGRHSVAALLDGEHVPLACAGAYRDAALRLLDRIEPLFARLAPPEAQQRIHADCHHGNLLWDAHGPFFLDFDDFTLGPPVQDLWLIAPGRDEDALQKRDALVDAYEALRSFDRRTLALVEPLRGLRVLRYAAWIAARYDDPAFSRAFPDFREEAFWRREVAALQELASVIGGTPASG
jgi:Ser/Thr protein kinase RdoA (MazF antagonist)